MDENLGERVKYLRKKLYVKHRELCSDLKIPSTSFNNIENGTKTRCYIYLYLITNYLNRKWQDKFKKYRNYPEYKGKTLEEITIHWLLFGFDPLLEHTEKYLKNVLEDFRQKELEYVQKNMELKSKIAVK